LSYYPTPIEPDQLLPVATNDGTPLGIGVRPAMIDAEFADVVEEI